MMTSVLAFVFVLGVLVILHEAGHFAVARLLGAPVEVFSVGFGKRLWGFERGGTDYRLQPIPFGGYVRIVGLGPDESDIVGGGESEAGAPAAVAARPDPARGTGHQYRRRGAVPRRSPSGSASRSRPTWTSRRWSAGSIRPRRRTLSTSRPAT